MGNRITFILLVLIGAAVFAHFLNLEFAQAQGGPTPAPIPIQLNPISQDTPVIDLPSGFAAFTNPVNCNQMTPPVIGIEISKGQSANDMAGLLTDLAASGYAVGTVNVSAGPIPACVDVLLVRGLAGDIFLPSAYSAAEGTVLRDWAVAGHGLLIASDFGAHTGNTQALFQPFGYTLANGFVTDSNDYDNTGPFNYWVIYQSDNFSSHPILNGVSAIELLASSWFNPSTNAIVRTDNNATAVPANVPVLAAFTQGQGCVVLSADSNWMADSGSGYHKQNNALAARQMVSWLDGCFTLSLYKSASTTIAQPGERITYTIQTANYTTASLTGVQITDAVPAGTSFVSASNPHSGPDANGVVTWNVGALGVNASAAVQMVVQLDNGLANGSIITNTASVVSSQGLSDSATTLVTVNAPWSFDQFLPYVAHNVCQETSTPADVILAMDISGSMNDPVQSGGTKLDAAQKAAETFINLLNFPLDQAGIVSFAATATLQHPLGASAASLINTLYSLTANGPTRIDLALVQFRQELAGPRHKGTNTPVIILLTDGKPTDTTPEAVLAEAAAAKAAGIVIYTIGLGTDVNITLMQNMATSPDYYYQAPTTDELTYIYEQIANRIQCNGQ